MEVDVGFFGRLADIAGRHRRVTVAGGQSTIAALRIRLAHEQPALGEAIAADRARALVDNVFVAEDFRPAAGQRIEFLPPVSGG